MLGLTGGVFLWIRSIGSELPVPGAALVTRAPAHAAPHLLAHVLLAIAVITIFARAMGALFECFLKQPPVMGEILAGLMLGPSLLGAISPAAYALLLPDAIAPHLGLFAQIGVVLFMFLVGLELDTKLLSSNSHATLAISHASIVVPFLLGTVLALFLFPHYAPGGFGFTVFALFIGVSLSVTAFPVLARILTDRRMQATELGVTALACAAVDDATAWCLLACVSAVAKAQLGDAGWTLALTVTFVAFMIWPVRMVLARLVPRVEQRGSDISINVFAVVFAGVLLCATATELIGIHALFGAFLFGAVLPHTGRLAEELRSRLEHVVLVLILPVFFAFTGMRTQIDLVSSARDFWFCLVIVAAATAGKFGGSFIAARVAGIRTRDAAALGVLMNTRGLMELVVLNVGLDMGVLSPTLFTMLVIMALVTTFSTTPVLNLFMRKDRSLGPAK
jgi:Kef-type K+ transport system membrane component KefB